MSGETIPERRAQPLVIHGDSSEGDNAIDDIERLAGRLLEYCTESRPPMTIADLAAVLEADPLRVGRAILVLHERGRLAVTCLTNDRFVLRVLGA